LHINGVQLAEFDADDAEVFMNDVAAYGDLHVDHIAGKLSTYAKRPSA
jgi:death-on-curing protein